MNTQHEKLRETIKNIDNLSQIGFSEIAAIANLALTALKTPDGYRHPQNIAYAFQVIRDKAQDIENCINAEAETVGCNYKDANLELRRVARAQSLAPVA